MCLGGLRCELILEFCCCSGQDVSNSCPSLLKRFSHRRWVCYRAVSRMWSNGYLQQFVVMVLVVLGALATRGHAQSSLPVPAADGNSAGMFAEANLDDVVQFGRCLASCVSSSSREVSPRCCREICPRLDAQSITQYETRFINCNICPNLVKMFLYSSAQLFQVRYMCMPLCRRIGLWGPLV